MPPEAIPAGREHTVVTLMENHSEQLDVADEDQLIAGRGYSVR